MIVLHKPLLSKHVNHQYFKVKFKTRSSPYFQPNDGNQITVFIKIVLFFNMVAYGTERMLAYFKIKTIETLIIF